LLFVSVSTLTHKQMEREGERGKRRI